MNEEIIHRIWGFAEKIQPVYKLLGWTWADKQNPPTVEEIVATIKMLIQDLIDSPDSISFSTGGLYAERDGDGFITFGFINQEDTF